MRHASFYTAILLGIMVLNICKYQVPYIQYNLFQRYIAENLCVKQNEANNCCQGKCFLEKQINLIDETDESSGNPVEKKPNNSETDDYLPNNIFLFGPVRLTEILLPILPDNCLRKLNLDVIVPPPKRFISYSAL
jgi:hypothetical protein